MMKSTLIILILLLFSKFAYSQVDLRDNIQYCSQYQKIYSYILNDSAFQSVFHCKNHRISIDSIGYGLGHPFTTKFYLANKYKTDPGKINLNDSLIKKEWIQIEKEDYYSDVKSEYSPCLSKLSFHHKNADIILQFMRKNENSVAVLAKPLKRKDRKQLFAFLYLFIFKNEDFEVVYQSKLIE
jgi:hypothetical protein